MSTEKPDGKTQPLEPVGSSDLVRQKDQLPRESAEELVRKIGFRIESRPSSLPNTVPVQCGLHLAKESATHLKKAIALAWTSARWLLWSARSHATSYLQYRILYQVFGLQLRRDSLLYQDYLPNDEAEPPEKNHEQQT